MLELINGRDSQLTDIKLETLSAEYRLICHRPSRRQASMRSDTNDFLFLLFMIT